MFRVEGSAIGLLTFVGYLLFMFGAALVWRGRDEVSVWHKLEARARDRLRSLARTEAHALLPA